MSQFGVIKCSLICPTEETVHYFVKFEKSDAAIKCVNELRDFCDVPVSPELSDSVDTEMKQIIEDQITLSYESDTTDNDCIFCRTNSGEFALDTVLC